jgi:hypothetical protein
MNVGAEWIDEEHKRRGWRGCGYHAVITRRGLWQDSDDGHPTRPIGRQGAHVGDCGPGWNARSLGVCLVGGLDDRGRPAANFTPKQMKTLEVGLRTLIGKHPLPDELTVLGHRDLIERTAAPPKACPCFDVFDWAYLVNIPAGVTLGVPVKQSTRPDRVFFGKDELPEDEVALRRNSALLVPDKHLVLFGDTLSAISLRYGVTLGRLCLLNPKLKGDKIYVDQILKLR